MKEFARNLEKTSTDNLNLHYKPPKSTSNDLVVDNMNKLNINNDTNDDKTDNINYNL